MFTGSIYYLADNKCYSSLCACENKAGCGARLIFMWVSLEWSPNEGHLMAERDIRYHPPYLPSDALLGLILNTPLPWMHCFTRQLSHSMSGLINEWLFLLHGGLCLDKMQLISSTCQQPQPSFLSPRLWSNVALFLSIFYQPHIRAASHQVSS